MAGAVRDLARENRVGKSNAGCRKQRTSPTHLETEMAAEGTRLLQVRKNVELMSLRLDRYVNRTHDRGFCRAFAGVSRATMAVQLTQLTQCSPTDPSTAWSTLEWQAIRGW